MSWLITRLIGLGVPQKLAKPLLVAIAAIVLIGALAGLRACDKRSIIEGHTARQDAANAKANRKADAKAADQRRADDTRLQTETQQIKEAVHEAGPDPAARRRAYYDCLLAQQAARRNGKRATEC